MLTFSGRGVCGGIAIGKIHIYKKNTAAVKRYKTEDSEAEIKRFYKACEVCDSEIESLYDKALKEIGESNAAIFDIHRMMLRDDDYRESVENIIRSEGVNADYAVSITSDNFANMFSGMEDEYMKARAADVRDISNRIIGILSDGGIRSGDITEQSIIFADDLVPSETVRLDKSKVLAFVTRGGSVNSHTAILARMMNIPAIVQCDVGSEEVADGSVAAVDGFAGRLIIEPDAQTFAMLRHRQIEEEEKKKLFETLKGRENITLDGKRIRVYANIAGPDDLTAVIANDAGGIGLFRSEFLYLGKKEYPDEEEQFAVYKRVVQAMAGKLVIIRTLDIGADKQIDYFGLDKEENPALGYRAIRICLDRPDMFKTQLRAMLRAASYGSVGIMYPMITSVDEIRKVKKLLNEAKRELDMQGISYGEVSQGIMIETPAAAVISDLLAPEVDFFSIGTNDLTQYMLAADRQNPLLDSYWDAYHPSIMRMIRTVADNAHSHGIWAGICGELGADTSLTAEFLKMGIDELSVVPSAILPIRKIVLESNSK